jgi:putative tryptophan/tyrosine transport system substrate-binding protein
MQRRTFISVVGGAVSWPFTTRAQQKAMPVVGYLDLTARGPESPSVAAFRRGLSEAGYEESKNVIIEYRFAQNNLDRLAAFAADLASRDVAIIVTGGGPASGLAGKRATSTIPIVFAAVGDPVAAGLVNSLARPGGNVTGFSILVTELNGKRFEMLSDLVPGVRAELAGGGRSIRPDPRRHGRGQCRGGRTYCAVPPGAVRAVLIRAHGDGFDRPHAEFRLRGALR